MATQNALGPAEDDTTNLVESDSGPSAPNFAVNRPDSLFRYCIDGNLSGVKQLILREGVATLSDCDEEGFTALHRAAFFRHSAICEFLLQRGAEPNTTSLKTGEAPLHLLPVNRSRKDAARIIKTAQVLVEYGADLDIKNSNSQTVLRAFEGFFEWPSRITLRHDMADCLNWLRSTTGKDDVDEVTEGRLYNGINVDFEVEHLDLILQPGADFQNTLGLQNYLKTHPRRWTALHFLMLLRAEPVWHPWSAEAIAEQTSLWNDAMSRILEDGIDPHAVDSEGNTPSSLAMRSPFAFHIWRNAVCKDKDLWKFVRKELEVCPALADSGWNLKSLHLLFTTSTEWRERPQTFTFADTKYNGLYIQCCWFRLLDNLKYMSLLPQGWEILTAPRQFHRAREHYYWHPCTRALRAERPIGGPVFTMEELSNKIDQGKDLVDELAGLGVTPRGSGRS